MANSTHHQKVLCLYTTSLYDKLCLDSSAFKSGRYEFISLGDKLRRYVKGASFDFVGAAKMCFDFIEDSDVDVVVALDDYSTPLLSLLVETFDCKFRGPSLESLFLTIHKFYTREVIDPNPVPFCYIDVKSPITLRKAETLANKVGLPAILKPLNGFADSLVRKVSNAYEISQIVNLIQKHELPIISDFKPLYSKFLDSTNFPLALCEGMILEKFIDGRILDLDGYIFNKEVYPWALYELFNYKSYRDVCQIIVMPCALAEEVQSKAWEMYETVSRRLIKHGYDNQFVNIQLFLCTSGDIRLLEVNGRMSSVCIPMCRRSLSPGDSLEALVQVVSGIKPPVPRPTGVHSAVVEPRCMISGKASDIIDFEAAKSMKDVMLSVEPDAFMSSNDVNTFTECGLAYLFADNRLKIFEQLDQLYSKLFKQNPFG